MGVPLQVWKQIAPSMQDKNLKAIFSASSQEQADELLEQWAKDKASDSMVVLSLMEFGPLLKENPAIRQWVNKNPQWSMAMPEVLTPGEAASLAQADYLLDAKQTAQLIEQLRKL